jgi:N-acetylneuraminate synthase
MDGGLLKHVRRTGKPVILSTGMSTMDRSGAVTVLGSDNLVLMHHQHLSLRARSSIPMVRSARRVSSTPVGYSGHEVGLVPSAIAVALGACMVERHLTLDRAMWGSDQAASVEPGGFERLVKYIRVTEESLGDGVKKVYESEKPSMRKLRRIDGQ